MARTPEQEKAREWFRAIQDERFARCNPEIAVVNSLIDQQEAEIARLVELVHGLELETETCDFCCKTQGERHRPHCPVRAVLYPEPAKTEVQG